MTLERRIQRLEEAQATHDQPPILLQVLYKDLLTGEVEAGVRYLFTDDGPVCLAEDDALWLLAREADDAQCPWQRYWRHATTGL
jgi:hypothetical protein